MANLSISSPSFSAAPPGKLELQAHVSNLELTGLSVGIDNIHFDVFLSPRFTEASRKYLLKAIRQASNLSQFFGGGTPAAPALEPGAFRRLLLEVHQQSLTQAKYEKNLHRDVLLRIAILKFLTEELGAQFANVLLEGKEWIRSRGEHFEHSEQAHVLKSRLSEVQGRRKDVFRVVGQTLYQMLVEVEETSLAKMRRALFGDERANIYDALKNKLIFVESGRDDQLFLEHYVLVGNYVRDPDRFEVYERHLMEFFQEFVPGAASLNSQKNAGLEDVELDARSKNIQNEIAQLERQQQSLKAQGEKGSGWLSSLARTSSSSRPGAELQEVEAQLIVARKRLEDVQVQLDGARRRQEFAVDEERTRLGPFLNEPQNARVLFSAEGIHGDESALGLRAKSLRSWISRLETSQLLPFVLATMETPQITGDLCPPLHLQQLKRALIHKDELRRVEEILKHLPARQLSIRPIEEAIKRLRKYSPEQVAALVLQFTERLMQLRRDTQEYQLVGSLMERIHLVRNERTRDLSRVNNTLYECVFPEEALPAEDRVTSHTVIKADVRGSTRITQELLARGLNPAAHFSLFLHEPVTRLLESFGAAKVFIEGDAIVLAIFESESNRAYQRAVARACVLGRQILAVRRLMESRQGLEGLPSLELGVGIAFQNSPPTIWKDGDSRIMISRALNHSDRLSSCSKAARRLLGSIATPFNVFLLQTVIEGATEEEAEDFLIRFNVDGVELNDEGFQKLSEEISLHPVEVEALMPWGRDRVSLFYGELPIGDGLQSIVIRKGHVRELLPGGKIGGPLAKEYYEVCTSPSLLELVESRIEAGALHG